MRVAAAAVPGLVGIDGETLAIAALGGIAVLALVFFAVKFAAGWREYRQVQRRDAESDERATDGTQSDERATDEGETETDDDRRRGS